MKFVPLGLSIVAVVLAGLALWKTPGPLPSLGSAISAYDFSTPEAAWRSGLEMQANEDLRAIVAFGRLLQEERNRTTKIEDSALDGDRVVLFLSLEEDGEPIYKTQGMKRLKDQDIWVPDYISSYSLRSGNAELATRMEEWEKRTKKAPGK
jgi:hypothetical protein